MLEKISLAANEDFQNGVWPKHFLSKALNTFTCQALVSPVTGAKKPRQNKAHRAQTDASDCHRRFVGEETQHPVDAEITVIDLIVKPEIKKIHPTMKKLLKSVSKS